MRNHVKTILVSFSAVLVLVAGTVVGTNLVTAISAPSAGSVTVTFNYNGATGGNTSPNETVTSGTQADDVLPHPTKPGVSFSGWFNTQSLVNGQRITTIEESDAGALIAGYVPPELAQTLNLVLPTASCAQGGACVLGNIGPGGGLVFLISGGKTYEMAPKAWGTAGAVDPSPAWCNWNTYVTTDTGIGTGATNTAAMKAVCTSGAANSATAYSGGRYTDWFLPSKDELNAMYLYSQVVGFDAATYGFAGGTYWSSSRTNANGTLVAWYQGFVNGVQDGSGNEAFPMHVRPVRAF
jgi:hypothetical protein